MAATGRLALRPTRFGIQAACFWLAMFAAFYAAPYSNLFFLLLGFLGLVLVAGTWGARRNVRGVSAVVDVLPPVPAGSDASVSFELRAPRPTRFQIGVRLVLVGERSVVGHVAVLDGEAGAAIAVGGLPRGIHRVERTLLESFHPFGLVRARIPVAGPEELVVYPAPTEATAGRSAADMLEELLGRTVTAGTMQPASLRDHRLDEGLQRVHWRASARRAKLIVQEWEGGGGQGLEVVLDRRADADELEDALRTLSALVSLARESKETLRIHTQGLAATFGPGNRPWADALRFLAGADRLPSSAAAPPVTGPGVLRLPKAVAA